MRRRLSVELKLVLRRALRLLTLRRVAKHPAALRPTVLLIVLLVTSAITVAYDAVVSGGSNLAFNEYGISDGLAYWGLIVASTVFFARRSRKIRLSRVVSDIATTGSFGHIAIALISALYIYGSSMTKSPSSAVSWAWLGIGWGVFGYVLFVLWRAGRSLWWGEVRSPGLRLVAISLLPLLLIPSQPTIHGDLTDWSRSDVWHWSREAYAWLDQSDPVAQTYTPEVTPIEDTLFRQASLLNGTLGGILPSEDGAPQYFFLAAAPSSAQDVFAIEVKGAKELFDTRFGTRGHSAVLINSLDTLDTVPLANTKNIEVALQEIGRLMNHEKDVLVLFITSHGTDGWVSVDLPGYPLNQITPESLAAFLDNAHIKNRVLIISACHSGSFIPRLEGPNTLIMTAARADRTSFGCTNGREWTYFGDALFNHALREETSFIKAFDKAKALIEKWEFWRTLMLQKRSEPQVSVGSEITKVLAAFETVAEDQRSDAVTDILRK